MRKEHLSDPEGDGRRQDDRERPPPEDQIRRLHALQSTLSNLRGHPCAPDRSRLRPLPDGRQDRDALGFWRERQRLPGHLRLQEARPSSTKSSL